MVPMLIGLLIFFGTHSIRVFAENWRRRWIARHGEAAWKGIYSLVSAIGLVLVVWGYGQMRQEPVMVWQPPAGMRHAVVVLMVPVFVLLVAAYIPRNHIRTRLGHPMLLAVKLWAASHLLANGSLGDMILFGAFLAWAVLAFGAARRRGPEPGTATAPPTAHGTALTVIVGLGAYGVFAVFLHPWLIGVPVLTGS